MIAPARVGSRRESVPAWHARFLEMLPQVERHAKVVFRHLDTEARAEAIQAVVCNACAATARLAESGKLDLAYPTVLARYAVAQYRDGRRVGCKLNIRDVSSPYCQRRKRITVDRLDHFDDEEGVWREAVVVDKRNSSVPDTVAFRCDFADWLDDLPGRDRRIAEFLAIGNGTSEAAQAFQVSPGRISQLRREFVDSWRDFVASAD